MPPAALPTLAKIWFTIVTPIVLVDGIFVLTRPPADTPNYVHPLSETYPFKFWLIYEKYDRRYGQNDDAFVIAQSWLNVLEVALGLVVVAFSLFGRSEAAIKLAIIVAEMTLYKTVLYFAIDYMEGFKFTNHNSTADYIMMVLMPSLSWMVFPSIIIKQCMSRLRVKDVAAKPQKSKNKPTPRKKAN